MRYGVFLVAALALGAWAAPAPKKLLPGDPVELKTLDGWALKAVFAAPAPGKMTLLLLHGTGQRKEDWKRLAFPLSREGYGVMAVDLRGHGDSRTTPAGEVITWKKLLATTKAANDFLDMSRDAEAATSWLAAQGTPEDSIGIIGAEVGGSIAIRYAATHPKVPLVVMLSPGMAWQEVLTVNALRAMKRPVATPLLMIYSEADKRSSKEAPILHSFARGAVGEQLAALISVPQERGTRMLSAQRDLAGRIIEWLGNPVAPEIPAISTAPAVSTQTPVAAPPDKDGED